VKLDWIYAEIADPSCNDFQWSGIEEVHVLFRHPLLDFRTEVFDREMLKTAEIIWAKVGKVPVFTGSSKNPIGTFYFIASFLPDNLTFCWTIASMLVFID
jgi:hypothetical protein